MRVIVSTFGNLCSVYDLKGKGFFYRRYENSEIIQDSKFVNDIAINLHIKNIISDSLLLKLFSKIYFID